MPIHPSRTISSLIDLLPSLIIPKICLYWVSFQDCEHDILPQHFLCQCPSAFFAICLPRFFLIPYLLCIDTVQAHTELSAVTHFKRQRITVGNLSDEP